MHIYFVFFVRNKNHHKLNLQVRNTVFSNKNNNFFTKEKSQFKKLFNSLNKKSQNFL